MRFLSNRALIVTAILFLLLVAAACSTTEPTTPAEPVAPAAPACQGGVADHSTATAGRSPAFTAAAHWPIWLPEVNR